MTETGQWQDPPSPSRCRSTLARVLRVALLLGLYFVGVCQWNLFYRGGNFYLGDEDWSKESDYYELLRGWLTGGPAPYHMSQQYQNTDRFLGLPETNLSPQILLLPYFDTGRFLFLNTLLMYSLGFVGCLLIIRRYRLDVLPSALLVVVFSFNGFITSHLSVGHSMWNGYFLLSFVCLYTLELLEDETSYRPALKLAAVLFVMMLQGAFHIVIWCWLLVCFMAVFHRQRLRQGLLVLAFSGWLSFFRLVPAAVTFWGHRQREFWSGYPTLTDLLDGLIRMGHHDSEWLPPQKWGLSHRLSWAEYDMYIGLFALGLLLYYGVYLRNDPRLARWRYTGLDVPMLLLFFLSLNYFFQPIANLGVPLLNAEGVTSRFLIIPLLLLLTVSTVRMQRVLEANPPSLAVYLLLGGGIMQTLYALLTHAYVWRVRYATSDYPPYVSQTRVAQRPDEWYVFSVQASMVVSLLAVVAWGYAFWRARRTAPLEPTTEAKPPGDGQGGASEP